MAGMFGDSQCGLGLNPFFWLNVTPETSVRLSKLTYFVNNRLSRPLPATEVDPYRMPGQHVWGFAERVRPDPFSQNSRDRSPSQTVYFPIETNQSGMKA